MIDYNDFEGLKCPKCGFDCGHIRRAEQIHCEYGIGVRVIIDGECGHTWRFRIIPWKGNLLLRNEHKEHDIDMPDKLEWRDLP